MGRIEDNRKKRKDTDSDPLKEIGKRNIKTKRGKIALGTSGRLRPKRKKFKLKPTTMANQDKEELK